MVIIIFIFIMKIIIWPIIILIINRIDKDKIKNIILLNSIKLIIKIKFNIVNLGEKFINKIL